MMDGRMDEWMIVCLFCVLGREGETRWEEETDREDR